MPAMPEVPHRGYNVCLTQPMIAQQERDLQNLALLHFSLDGELQARDLPPETLTLPIHALLCTPATRTQLAGCLVQQAFPLCIHLSALMS